MMKLFTKILAGCCALAMVFSLAACKDTPADEPDSTGDAAVNLSEATPGETVAQADDMSETAPEEDSAQTPADTEEAQSQNGQTPPSTEKNTAASPNSGKDLSKTEVLALYQAGTKKSSLKRTKYNRQLTYGKLWSPGNFDNAQFDLVEDKEKAAPIFNGTDTASKAVTLPTLQESLVESATCKEAGRQACADDPPESEIRRSGHRRWSRADTSTSSISSRLAAWRKPMERRCSHWQISKRSRFKPR